MKVLLIAVVALAGFPAGAVSSLETLARDDYAHAIRPGGVDGAPFWNVYARMFLYPPAFDFSKGGPGTVKYRFTVFDAAGKTHVFDAPSSQSPLTPVWNELAPGQAWVYVSAVDKDGGVHGIPDWPRDRFSRTFWRSAPFRPGAYPSAPRSYAEAVAKCGDEIFERPATQYFLKAGKPDPDYKHNCYPSKMHAALIHGMLGYALARPDRAADALKLARNAADYLIGISQPAGTPLEYWPPTYADKREAGSFRYGQVMLIYPCEVGAAYLALYDRVKDAQYLAAAKRLADTYIKLQEKDGTWPIFIREADGKILNDNRVQPVGVISFLEALYKACGEAKYRACADRAFAWVEAHPLKDWFWEGQFEDAPLVQKYENPSKHPACAAALYLLKRFPGDQKWLAVARDLVRYAEDQFVCWEKPCAANGHGVNTPIGDPFAQQNRYHDWFFPCALEQYVYYVPVDASNAKMIKTYLALYRAEKNPLDLAKARALGDALVRTQQPSGYIPTEYAKVENRSNPMQGWLNCSCASLSALAELAETVAAESRPSYVEAAQCTAHVARPAYSETWRIGVEHYRADAAFAKLTDFLQREKATGRCALFVATGHSPGKLELLKPQIEMMGKRCAELRKLGYAAGPNILCTIGQGKEAVELSADVPGAQFIVGSEGETSCCRHCMRDPVWREGYIKPLYEMLAKAKPDFIWIDDDLRLNWNDVAGPACFCPRCLGLIRKRLGFKGTHKDLAAFFADAKEGLARRCGLLQLNREMFADLYAYVGGVVRSVDPKIQLGIMCGGYGGLEGNCQTESVRALSPDGAPVLYRPGGGFYRESDGLESLLWKANNIGYETARLPGNAISQSEIELHPKIMLYKSPQLIASESLAYIAAGASGTAWNFFASDIDASTMLMRPAVASRPQAQAMVAAAGKGAALGVWDGRGKNGFAGNRRGGKDGNWLMPDFEEKSIVCSELQQLGIPLAYREAEAEVIAPNASAVTSWTKEETERYLAKPLYLSADAVEALCARGYGADVGFTAGGEQVYELEEEFADHPLNRGIVGMRRNSCATFLKGHARVLKPCADAQVTGWASLYGKRTGEAVSGTFLNKRGGRIYATGFFPYARMMDVHSVRHFRAVFDWLAGGALVGRVASYHRAVLFLRGDLVSVLNTSIGDYDDLEIVLRGEKWAKGLRTLDGSGMVLTGTREGPYTRYRLPHIRAWTVAAFAPQL